MTAGTGMAAATTVEVTVGAMVATAAAMAGATVPETGEEMAVAEATAAEAAGAAAVVGAAEAADFRLEWNSGREFATAESSGQAPQQRACRHLDGCGIWCC